MCFRYCVCKRDKISKVPSFPPRGIRYKGRGLNAAAWSSRKRKRGTHNVLAAPVLMLRPEGPLADRANAMLGMLATVFSFFF